MFQGSLKDMPVVGLLQSLEMGRTTGCIRIRAGRRGGSIWLDEGRPSHASFSRAAGAEALYRLLDVERGTFRVDFGRVPGDDKTIDDGLNALLMEGARRSDEMKRLWDKVPSRDAVVVRITSDGALTAEDYTLILRCDGKRTLEEVVDGSEDALETLQSVHRLWKQGALEVARRRPSPVGPPDPRDGTSTDKLPVREALELEGDEVPRRSRAVWWAAAGLAIAAGLGLQGYSVLVGDDAASAPVSASAPQNVQPAEPIPVAAPTPRTCPASTARIEGEGETFCMDIHEITVRAFARCADKGECLRAHSEPHWSRGKTRTGAYKRALGAYGELCNVGREGHDDHPVNCVTHEQAQQYCRFVGKQLPTGKQWALAAGGVQAHRYPWGEDRPSVESGNFCGPECRRWKYNSGLTGRGVMYAKPDLHAGTAPVGSYPDAKSPFGVLDMAGNVFEWTADPAPARGSEPAAYVRGGSFTTSDPSGAEVSAQVAEGRSTRSPAIGFRCVATLP